MPCLDLQVNGFGGVDFNSDALTAEQLHTSMQSLQQNGAQQILATLITADLADMRHRIQRLITLRAADPLASQIIAGLHLEGPFINPQPGYVGAHPPEHVRTASLADLEPLLEAGAGLVKLVTLAPEQDATSQVTKFLTAQGIAVAAGHTAATLDQLRAAAEVGLSLFTHVGNGCPIQLPRHDHIINRALALADRLWLCFIPDGAHIPFYALKNYLRCASPARCIAVTDAISAAGQPPGIYPLGKGQVRVGEDHIARAPDGLHLAGSTLTQSRLLENLRTELGLTSSEITAMTVDNPWLALRR